MLVPAFLMVSTIRFRSFKTIDLHARRSYKTLVLFAAVLFAIVTHPRWTLLVIAYGYLVSAFVEMGVNRWRHRGGRSPEPAVGPEPGT
jgi:phosphatidylserine synthase